MTIDESQIDGGVARGAGAVRARRGGADAEGPYKIQYELQDMMQDNVGIVRNEGDMKKALDGIAGAEGSGRRRSPSAATASTTPAGTRRWTSRTC